MSSVISYTATTKTLPVKFTGISGPWYNDTTANQRQLYPFVITRKGELDLNIDYDGFATWFNNGDAPSSTGTSGYAAAKLMGGQQLITGLGPNFKQYIRNWFTSSSPNIDGGTTGDSPINIYINPVMTKVQLSHENTVDTDNIPFTNTNKPPSSDDYIFGGATDTFKTSWIFKTPLTFTYLSGGELQYVTMYSLLQTDYA
jgi:hypothetical protein